MLDSLDYLVPHHRIFDNLLTSGHLYASCHLPVTIWKQNTTDLTHNPAPQRANCSTDQWYYRSTSNERIAAPTAPPAAVVAALAELHPVGGYGKAKQLESFW
jgi:hypothetical protein